VTNRPRPEPVGGLRDERGRRVDELRGGRVPPVMFIEGCA
jgi:hypothetical protein